VINVAIEAPSKTARFAVGVRVQSIEKALCILAARYPKSLVRMKFPIEPEGFFKDAA
jgi:hypothetical protein